MVGWPSRLRDVYYMCMIEDKGQGKFLAIYTLPWHYSQIPMLHFIKALNLYLTTIYNNKTSYTRTSLVNADNLMEYNGYLHLTNNTCLSIRLFEYKTKYNTKQ